jgi:hypothetical protein
MSPDHGNEASSERSWLTFAIAIPLLIGAWSTGHITMASIAAGAIAWLCGGLVYNQELKNPSLEFRTVPLLSEFALNVGGLSLILFALYRFCKFGFWPISALI